MKLSYWEHSSFFNDIDIAIIGSGIVGLNAALHIKEKQPKLNVSIFEKGFLPAGASTKNAGFGCFGSVSELLSDLENLNENEVFQLVEKRWRGLQKLRSRIGDKNLKYQALGGFELFKKQDLKTFESCSNKIDYFNKALQQITNQEITYKIADQKIKQFEFGDVEHIIENRLEGQLDTGVMIKSLIQLAIEKGIQIFNGFSVEELKQEINGVEIISKDDQKIRAKKLIVATNGFAKKLLPKLKVIPARNQVLVTEVIPELKLKGTFHYDEGFIYFRNIENRILIGGARNQDIINETTAEFGQTDIILKFLKEFINSTILPGFTPEIEYQWSGIMGLGALKNPIIKKVSDNIFVAVRLGGMGVAIGSLIGEEVAELCFNN